MDRQVRLGQRGFERGDVRSRWCAEDASTVLWTRVRYDFDIAVLDYGSESKMKKRAGSFFTCSKSFEMNRTHTLA